MKPLARWEVACLVESLEGFIRAVVTDAASPHVEDAIALTRKRDAFIETLFEHVGDGEDD